MDLRRHRRPSGQGARRELPRHWGMDLHPVRWTIAAGLVCSVLRAALQWLAPVPLKLIFDDVLGNQKIPGVLDWLPASRSGRLVAFCVGMVLIAVLFGVASYGANALLANAGQRVVFDLRLRLFRHLEDQSAAFHQRRPVGDLLARLGGDVQAMQSVVISVVPVVVESAITVTGMVVIMLVLDWRFSLLALLLLPVLWWVVRHYLAAIRTAQRDARRSEGLATAAAQQTLVALPVVQAFGGESAEAARYGSLSRQGLTANRHAVVLQSRFTPIVSTLMTGSTALVMLIGAQQVLAHHLTAGDLLVFSAYFRGMYSPARQMAKLAGTVGRGHASAERVMEILSTHDSLPTRPGARQLRRVRGAVAFEGVSFSHSCSPVLDGIDLVLAPGSMHALVGATGSGKSTLLRLVARFADPDAGRVTLDGVDLRDLDLGWLRRQIALVPQEMALLRPTVWENIAYGSPGATLEDVVAAARAVGVHDVLAGLRDGYGTEVGEGGSALSGGQRQCVSMARAMIRNAPILLLDEPTTGLDAGTESTVLAGLDRLCQGRTTLFVSHQMAAVRAADNITVLAHGRVVEQGRHSDLVGAGLAYSTLHRSSAATAARRRPVSVPHRSPDPGDFQEAR